MEKSNEKDKTEKSKKISNEESLLIKFFKNPFKSLRNGITFSNSKENTKEEEKFRKMEILLKRFTIKPEEKISIFEAIELFKAGEKLYSEHDYLNSLFCFEMYKKRFTRISPELSNKSYDFQIEKYSNLCSLCNYLGSTYRLTEKYNESIKHYEKAVNLLKSNEIMVLNGLSNVKYEKAVKSKDSRERGKLLEESKVHAEEALKICSKMEKVNDKQTWFTVNVGLAFAKIRLAKVYIEEGSDYIGEGSDAAIDLLNEAKELGNKLNDKKILGDCFSILGDIYRKKSVGGEALNLILVEKSITHYKEAIKIARETHPQNVFLEATVNWNMGLLFGEVGYGEKCTEHLKKSQKLFSDLKLVKKILTIKERCKYSENQCLKFKIADLARKLKNVKSLDCFSIGKKIGGLECRVYDKVYKSDEKLGNFGVNSRVYSVFFKDQQFKDFQLALKVVLNYNSTLDSESLKKELLQNEVHPRMQNHSNILNVIHSFVGFIPNDLARNKEWKGIIKNINRKTVFIVTQRFKMNLQNYIDNLKKRKEFISELKFLHFLRDILEGICHIHSKFFVHCEFILNFLKNIGDIKPDNILISKGETLVVADFGNCTDFFLARSFRILFNVDRFIKGGSPHYCPPEIINTNPGTNVYLDYNKYDVFSCGILSYELLSHDKEPWGKKNRIDEHYKSLPEYYSKDIRDLVRGMLLCDPHARTSGQKALQTVRVLIEKIFKKT